MNYYEFLKSKRIEILWEKHYSCFKIDFYNVVYKKDGIVQRKIVRNPETDLGIADWMEFHNNIKDNKENPKWNPITCHEQGTIIYLNYNWYILLHAGRVEKVPFEISNNLTVGEEYYFGIGTEKEIPFDENHSTYKRMYYICEESKCRKHTEDDIIWKMEITREGYSGDTRYLD